MSASGRGRRGRRARTSPSGSHSAAWRTATPAPASETRFGSAHRAAARRASDRRPERGTRSTGARRSARRGGERLAVGGEAERGVDDHWLAGVDQLARASAELVVRPAVDLRARTRSSGARAVGARPRSSLRTTIGRQHVAPEPLGERRRRASTCRWRRRRRRSRPAPSRTRHPSRSASSSSAAASARRRAASGAVDLAGAHERDLRADQRPLGGEEADQRVVAGIAARLAVGRDERARRAARRGA